MDHTRPMTPKQLAAHVVRKVSERIQRALGVEPEEEVECPIDPTTAHLEASTEDALVAVALARLAKDAADRGDEDAAREFAIMAMDSLYLAGIERDLALGRKGKAGA